MSKETIYNIQALSAKLNNGNRRKLRAYAIPPKMQQILDISEKTLIEILSKYK